MTTTLPPPPQGDFVFDTAVRALDDQMRWIDALDVKAGVLMASDGVIAGLVLTRGSILLQAPLWVGVLVALLLFVSLVLALLSFSTRRFEIAPDIVSLATRSQTETEASLRASAVPGIIDALQINESKVGQKANLLFMSGTGLMLSVAVFGGNFISQVLRANA
jgi:hypothetical protein